MQNKNIVKALLLLLLFIFCITFTACTDTSTIEAPKGEDGVDGIDGKDGKNGTNGLNGSDGAPITFSSNGSTIYYSYTFGEDTTKHELTSYEAILACINYNNDIYVISSKVNSLQEGDVITVEGKSGIVGMNAFNTMANALIYVNALPKDRKPIIYLDEGKINEVFHLKHDNITIYGPASGITDLTYRAYINEAIFTGSVSVEGDNITMDGVAVDDLTNTITVKGKNFTSINVIEKKEGNK